MSILHQHSLYHSDVKPSNILISSPSSIPTAPTSNPKPADNLPVKILNFANLLTFQDSDRFHKKLYCHAEYLSPEQIEKSEDVTIMQCGEVWNLGVLLYALYQGEFPFPGETDEEIIQKIITKPNNWTPKWKEGLPEIVQSFIMMCLEADPFKRIDKIQFFNHPYILQNFTPPEIVLHGRLLVSNYQKVFEIYSSEQFVEAILSYYLSGINIKKQMGKVQTRVKAIARDRLVFVPLEKMQKAY